MALAHPGYAVGRDARLRILLGIFEAVKEGRPPSHAELMRRTHMPRGSLTHHIPKLVESGLLERVPGARGVRLTKHGVHALAHEGLVEVVAQEPVYSMTAKGLKLLEEAPTSEGRAL